MDEREITGGLVHAATTRGLGRGLLLGMGVAIAACGDPSATAQLQPGFSTGYANGADVLATIGDQPITLADIHAVAGDELDQIEVEYRRARSQVIENALHAVLRERVFEAEAREQNTTVAQLVAAEAGGSVDPTDLEITAWYEANQDRVGGRPLDVVRPQILAFLRNERSMAATLALEHRLNEERNVVIHFEPFRFELSNDDAPYVGGRNALVTLAVFSDFQCPYCARFAGTLHRLHDEFRDDLRIVYRQFPLTSIHPNAFKAAEASLCAHEHGRFWEMHDAMFDRQNRLTVSSLKQLAGELGLDARRFETCLDTGRYTEQVQNDMAEGSAVGVTGTPALLLNGVPLPPGAQPFEVVAGAVRKELARVRR